MKTLDYTGYNDVRIGKDGEWVSPASAWGASESNVVAVWTPEGYKPRDADFPEWLDEHLDENGAIKFV